eukprot:18403_1
MEDQSDDLKALLIDHIEHVWNINDWWNRTEDVLNNFYALNSKYPEDEYGGIILDYLFDIYPVPSISDIDSEKPESERINVNNINNVENNENNINNVENNINNVENNHEVIDQQVDPEEKADDANSHMLDSIETLESFLDNHYDYGVSALNLLNSFREAVIDLGESTEICDCGFYKINGYHANNKCAGCSLKYFAHMLLSPQSVLNDQSVLKEADQYYEEFIDENDRVAELSKCIELCVIGYLSKTINLIGSSPISWTFLQGKPNEPKWETIKNLDYLQFFRCTIITHYMNRLCGKDKQWIKLGNCVKELVALGQIRMFRICIYKPVADRHEYNSDDGSFNRFFRFQHEILEAKIRKERHAAGEREPTLQELEAKWDQTYIRQHIFEVVFDSNDENYKWYMKRLAKRRQMPHIKATSGFGLIGPKGSGKDTLFDFVEVLFDTRNCVKFSELSKICGRFNADVTDRMFVCCNEVNKGDLIEYLSLIKGFITNLMMHRDNKFIPRSEVPMFQEFYFFSNYIDAIVPLMTQDSRRLAVFGVSSCKLGNVTWFRNVQNDIKNIEIVQNCWEMLGKMDISDVDYRILPETAMMKRMRMRNVENNALLWLLNLYLTEYDQTKKHLSPFTNMNPNGEIFYFGITDAYKDYKSYIAENKLGIIQPSNNLKDYLQNTLLWERKRYASDCEAYTSKSSNIFKFVKLDIKEKLLAQKIPETMFEDYKYFLNIFKFFHIFKSNITLTKKKKK